MGDAILKTIEAYESFSEEDMKDYFDFEGVRCFAEFFRENLNGRNVLDVGCGPGRDAKYFSENGLDVTGIDLADNFLTIASRMAPKAQFISMDMRKLDFADSSFDGAWINSSFLHIPKKESKSTLSELKRILKPDGLMFLAVKEGKEECFVDSRFYAFYERNELKSLLDSSGLKIIKFDCIENRGIKWICVFCQKNI